MPQEVATTMNFSSLVTYQKRGLPVADNKTTYEPVIHERTYFDASCDRGKCSQNRAISCILNVWKERGVKAAEFHHWCPDASKGLVARNRLPVDYEELVEFELSVRRKYPQFLKMPARMLIMRQISRVSTSSSKF